MDRARVVAALVSTVMIAATLEPLLRDPYDDGFPLSTYPMFATKRQTKQTYSYALGVTRDGQRRILNPRMIGSGEILQALQVINLAVSRGETKQLCEAVAARVAADDEFTDVVAIRIVTGTHDAVDYLSRDIVGREHERVRCEVKR